jgi:zinc protease
VNAYTSYDETVYMLQVPTDSGKFLDKGIQILADWAHGQTFDSSEVDAERGVVSEEWRLRRGAGARMQDAQLPMLFKGSRYADRLVIGSIEGLKTFPQSALRQFYQQWYRPDMMAVVAVGDFDKAAVEQMIRTQFGGIPKAPPMMRPAFPIPAHDSIYVAIATDREAPNSSFSLVSMLPRRDQSTMGAFRERYVERLGLDMLNARMAEIAQKPDAPFAFAAANRGYYVRSADSYSLFGGVKPGAVLRGFEAAMTEVERASRFGFSASELDRAKASQFQFQSMMYAQREQHQSGERAAELLRNFLQDEDVLGTIAEYQLYKRLGPTITIDEVNRATRALLAGKNQVITVNAPDKAGIAVPTDAEMLAVFHAVKAKTLEPYHDNIVTGPLVANIPAPAAITATRAIPELGITEWTLANGVRVVLKPTDFLVDQIILSGTSPGGTSLVPDSNFVSATFAATAASVGGAGTYSATDLRKLLTGKTANASLSIGTRTENAFGVASPQDLETMFQLLYLRFTATRKDSAAFQAFRQSNQASMANAAASPTKAYSDTIAAIMSQHNARSRPMSPTTFDEIDLDRALAIYRDRFADASDFTFTIVGSFNIDTIKPLVQRYLGGLPSLHRKEAPKDLGIRPPTGTVEQVVRRGSEPQSQTFMAFSGPYQYSELNDYMLATLGELLTNRLTDHLREKLGGTYGVGARLSGSRTDAHMFTATVSFGSAPDRAEELTKAVFADIKALSDSGPTAAEIEKVRTAQTRARETNVKTNFFWTNELGNAYQNGDDPRAILAYDKLVAGLNATAVRDAVRKYLKGDNYVHVTLLPATITP